MEFLITFIVLYPDFRVYCSERGIQHRYLGQGWEITKDPNLFYYKIDCSDEDLTALILKFPGLERA
jgi:hypothetical protein